MRYSSSQNMVLNEQARVVAHAYGATRGTKVEATEMAARIARLLNAEEDMLERPAGEEGGLKPLGGGPEPDLRSENEIPP